MTYPLIRPTYYRTLLGEVIGFLRRPRIGRVEGRPRKRKVYDTIGLYGIKVVALVPLVLFFAVVYDPENVQSASMAERFSPVVLLLLGGLVLPFVEEVGFRLSLVFKPAYLAMTSSVIAYYILTKAVFQTKVTMVDDSFVLRLVTSCLVGGTLFLVVRRPAVASRLAAFWDKRFAVIFYVVCVSFAWMHVVKYEPTLTNIVLAPVLTLPQLLSALIYGYLRVSYGFWYPLLLHMGANSATLSVFLLAS